MAKATKPKDETPVKPVDETPPEDPASDTPVVDEAPATPVDPYEAPPREIEVSLEVPVQELVEAVRTVQSDEGAETGRFEVVNSVTPDGTPIKLRRNIDTGDQIVLE